MKNPEDSIPSVLERVNREYIKKTYKIESWTGADNFLQQMAKKTGKLLKVCNLFIWWLSFSFIYFNSNHIHPSHLQFSKEIPGNQLLFIAGIALICILER